MKKEKVLKETKRQKIHKNSFVSRGKKSRLERLMKKNSRKNRNTLKKENSI